MRVDGGEGEVRGAAEGFGGCEDGGAEHGLCVRRWFGGCWWEYVGRCGCDGAGEEGVHDSFEGVFEVVEGAAGRWTEWVGRAGDSSCAERVAAVSTGNDSAIYASAEVGNLLCPLRKPLQIGRAHV